MAHVLRSVLLLAGRLVEGLAVAVAGLGAGLLVPRGRPTEALMVVAVALVVVNALAFAGLYADERGYGRRRSAVTAALITLVTVPVAERIVTWLAGTGRVDGVVWAVLAATGVGLVRGGWGLVLHRLARLTTVARRVLVVGDRDRTLEVLSVLAGDERRWAFPVGVCLDRDPPRKPTMGGFIAGLDHAEAMVREHAVDDVIVAIPWSDSLRLSHCLEVLRPLTVDVHLFPESAAPFARGEALSLLAGVPMAKVGARPLSGRRALAKTIEDRVLGALILLAALPLMAMVALAIKLDSRGPVLFRQSRYGYDNQPFTCFKFRSMEVNDDTDVRQATRDDPRVTRVGRFLRRTSLDELPQLFNVIAGTMSLVGPRPHAVSHHHYYARLVDDYRCRHRMKPGITGWAQIHGYRGETSTVELMRKRVVHDLWYIDHWSLGLDLAILARTPLACLKGTNAY
ncbi:MAG: undecaprenyl-phosphate glucose phosphotransferase [Solirubrobacterales bacterium]